MKLKRTIRKTFTNVIEHDVPKSAAALTYNLLFALFPLLIFISNLLGLLDLNVASITEALLPIMPDDVVYLLERSYNWRVSRCPHSLHLQKYGKEAAGGKECCNFPGA